ncbi:MAG: hypothetical protein WCF46_03930 [Nitrososphaeraceae archaeon]
MLLRDNKSSVLLHVSTFESYMRLTDVYKESQSRLSIKTVELEAIKNLNEVQEEVDKFRK